MDFSDHSAKKLEAPMNTFGTEMDETQEYNDIHTCRAIG